MALNLKVEVGAAQKMYRFNQDMTVFEVCKQIREKSAATEGTGADHGLFQPGDGVRMGRWLRPERTLMFYDLKSGDLVMYRKKHRPLKVQTLDGTCKMVLVDDSENVWQIVEAIGQKLDIKNPEEYSLARIVPPPPPGTPAPAQQMGTPWLHPTQSLADQGIEANDTVQFKKKFFVTDAAVDKSDPIQLNLLYVQCKDMVISGSLPCQLQEAVQLAALQLQVDEGGYNGTRYEKKGSMKELYPRLFPPYFQRQAPAVEKDVVAMYKTLAGMSEINAKYRYVSFTRSLKLYGLTCYEVLERDAKNPKRQRAVLLGVSKEQILRLDRDTRDEFHRNEITQLKRWAASPTTLTLDFGDYEAEYYIVQTPEGEAISQLIAGYIDILLKRKRDIGRKEVEDDSAAAAEEFIAPIRSTAVETTTTSIGLGTFSAAAGHEGMMGPGGQSASMSGGDAGAFGGRGVNAAKGQQMPTGRAIVDPDSAAAGIKDMLDELEEADPWARLPSELSPEQWRQKLQEALMGVGAGVQEMVKNASLADKSAMNQTAKSLFQNVMELMTAARMGGLEGEDDINLLEGAKLVSEAVRRILECAKDLAENPADPALRARVAEAARLLQAAQIQLGQGLQGKLISDPDSADLVLQSAKAVAAAAKALKDVTDVAAAKIPDPAKRDPLRDAADAEYAQAQSLYELGRALAPVILAPGAKSMLEENAKGLQSRLGDLLKLAKLGVSDPSLLDRIAKATKDVNDAVAQLLLANDCAATTDAQDLAYHQRRIGEGVELIEAHRGQRAEIVRGSGQVGQSGLALVAGAKRTATLLDAAAQEHLLASAKVLAEHTNQSVAAAKTAIGNLQDDNAHARLLEAAQRVKRAADALVGDAGKAVQYKLLEHAAKNAAAATGALYHTDRAALVAGRVTDEPNKARLNEECTRAKAALDKLLEAVRRVNAAPDDKKALEELYQAAKAATTPGLKMVNATRAAIPRIADMATKRDMNTDAEAAKRALQALQAAIRGVAEATGAREVEDAQLLAETAVAEADALALNAADGRYAEPQQLEPALAALEEAARRLDAASHELRETAVAKPDHLGLAARATGRTTADVSEAARTVVLSTADKAVQGAVCDATKALALRVKDELHAARARVVSPEDKAASAQLDASAAAVRAALQALLAAAAGGDVAAAECDEAAAAIVAETRRIDERSAHQGVEWAQGAEELDGRAKQLSAALTQVVVSSKSNPRTLGTAAATSAVAFQGFVEALNAAIGAAPAPAAKAAVAAPARDVGAAAAALVALAKGARRDPARMDAAYVTLSRALQALLGAVDAATPGSAEIAAALDAILAALARLGAHDAARDKAAHRQQLNEAAKALTDTVATLSTSARARPDAFGALASNTAAGVEGALGAAAGLTPDVLELGHALDRIADALAALNSPATLLPAAKEVARAAHVLVLQTRAFVPANAGLDAAVRRELVQSAQAVAALTSRLAAAAKAQVANPAAGDGALKSVQKELAARVEAVRAAQAKVAAKAKHPPALLQAARQVGEACAGMVRTLKAVNARPKDAASQAQLTTNTIGVAESVKRMVEAATALVPGQRECDEAIARVQNEIGELAAQAVVAAVGVFAHRLPDGLTVSAAQESVANAAERLGAAAARLADAGKGSGAVGAQAEGVAQAAAALTACTLDAAATSTDAATQQARLNMAKAADEAVLALLRAVKAAAANPTPAHQKAAADAAVAVRDAVALVVAQMKHNVQGLRLCDEAIASIRQTEAQLPQAAKDTSKSYGEVRAALQASGRELVQTIGGILQNAAAGSADDVGAKSQRTAELLRAYMDTTKLVIVATADAQDRQGLNAAARAVCQTAAALVDAAKKLTPDAKNQDLQSNMNAAFAHVTEAIRALGESISRAAKGERDCEAALDELQRINGDLEMAALFAATGQLDAADAGTTIETHHAALTAAAAELDREQEALVAASARSLDAVGTSARNAAATMAKLAKSSKGAAALLNDDQAQKGILGSVKNLGSATQQLVQLSKDLQTAPAAESKARQAEAQEAIKESLAMLTEIVNAAAGQIVRGLQELEKAKIGIARAVQAVDTQPGKAGATAKDAGDAARRMVAANNELLSALAAQNWDAIAAAAAAEAAANTDLLQAVKGAVASPACDAAVRAAVLSAAKAAAASTTKLLEAGKYYRPDSADTQAKLTAAHEDVQARLQAFVAAARQLPDGHDLDLDGEALARQTEAELLAAAQQIEEAGGRIRAAKPLAQWPADQQRQAQISEAILDAAKAISKATGGLMQATVAAQRELAAKGRANKLANPYQKDPAWAQSLIGAARAVAASNEALVRDANTASERRGHEEQLAGSAKEVANTTARLVAASKTKADSNSPAQAKLEVAAKSVALATQKLVEACKIAANMEEEERQAKAQREADREAAAQRDKEFKLQVEIARLEKELQRAKARGGALPSAKPAAPGKLFN